MPAVPQRAPTAPAPLRLAVDDITLKMVAKNCDDRFADMGELRAVIAKALGWPLRSRRASTRRARESRRLVRLAGCPLGRRLPGVAVNRQEQVVVEGCR
jgi:hypothetical protein